MSVSKTLDQLRLRLFYLFNAAPYEPQSELDEFLMERIKGKSLLVVHVPDEWGIFPTYVLEVTLGKTYIMSPSGLSWYVFSLDEKSPTHSKAYNRKEHLLLTRYTSEKLSDYFESNLKVVRQSEKEAARKEQILKLNLTKGN